MKLQKQKGPNRLKKEEMHRDKRKSMKFQKIASKKASKKQVQDKNLATGVTGNDSEEEQEYNNQDEDRFESAGNERDEESSFSENNNDDDDSDDEIYDPAFQQQKLLQNHPPLLIILDLASLETVKSRKGDFQLLNCDDHIGLIRKFHKDPSEYRPDIIHQELMTVLDSPLNKAGKVKVLVHTEKNVLFEVSNKTRIPRTFKRFSGLMVQLLHRLKIRSADGRDMLLKVVKNPISRHIPAGARIIGFSDQGIFQTPMQFAKTIPNVKNDTNASPTVLIFGAQATRGILKEDHPYIQEMVSISNHGLSGVVAINRVLGAIETHWNIS